MVARLLIVLFLAYIAQLILATLQIRRSYAVINRLKAEHKGENVFMASGTGRQRFLIISQGFFTILLVDANDVIVDYYCMKGFTVFASPKRDESMIGLTLDQAQGKMTRTNQIKSFSAAREQIEMLRRQATANEENVSET